MRKQSKIKDKKIQGVNKIIKENQEIYLNFKKKQTVALHINCLSIYYTFNMIPITNCINNIFLRYVPPTIKRNF